MKITKHTLLIGFLLVIAGFLSVKAGADTLSLKNGEKVTGLIVDEYVDRIIISTEEGEKTYVKKQVKSISYHDKVNHFIQKARNEFRAERYLDAFYHYKEALSLDPENKESKEKMEYIEKYLITKPFQDMVVEVDSKKRKMEPFERISYMDRLKKEFGITLAKGDKYVFVAGIDATSKNTLKEGDNIISVWGEEGAYSSLENIAKLFLVPGGVKLEIERKILMKFGKSSFFQFLLGSRYKKIIGASLEYTEEGLSVVEVKENGPFYKADICEGDILEELSGESLEYLPLSSVIGLIVKNADKDVELLIRRRLMVWIKGAGK